MKDKDYVVVTAISSYRMRYVMHRDDLQKLNPKDPVNAIEWANDTVTTEECEEFSQEHMGEYIVDTVEMNEAEMLALFDKDNDYLRDWTKDQVVAMVRNSIKSDPALTKLEVAQNLTITTAQAIVDANAASWDAQQHVYMTQEEYQDALEMLSLAEQQQ